MTQITVKQLAAVKRTAMNVAPLVSKKARLQKKIDDLYVEIESLNKQIDAQQGYVKEVSGGLTTEQLVTRTETGAYTHNPEVLFFDEEKRVYVVKEHGDNAGGEVAHDDAPETGALASAEEAEAEAKVKAEEEAAEQERLQEEEAARLKAEEEAEEARRQEEIRAAKERLTASRPAAAAPAPEPKVEEPDDDPFA